MNAEHFNYLISKSEEFQNLAHKSYFNFYKSVSTLNVALIGLLIGLKPSSIPNAEAKIAFFVAIVLIGSCILFSLGIQYYEVDYSRQFSKFHKERLNSYVKDPRNNGFDLDLIRKKWFYKLFEYLTFLCLILSIVALIIYVYFLEF